MEIYKYGKKENRDSILKRISKEEWRQHFIILLMNLLMRKIGKRYQKIDNILQTQRKKSP